MNCSMDSCAGTTEVRLMQDYSAWTQTLHMLPSLSHSHQAMESSFHDIPGFNTMITKYMRIKRLFRPAALTKVPFLSRESGGFAISLSKQEEKTRQSAIFMLRINCFNMSQVWENYCHSIRNHMETFADAG